MSATRPGRAAAFSRAATSAQRHPLGDTKPGDESDEGQYLIDLVTEDLTQNFCEQITLQDIGYASGYSVYQIIRAFRRRLGTTPHAYLMRMRIEYAAERLSQGDSIAGAAADAGFSDQSHLTRHFKRVFGTTPGRYVLAQR
jgi:AraC-like DNA-binding protein